MRTGNKKLDFFFLVYRPGQDGIAVAFGTAHKPFIHRREMRVQRPGPHKLGEHPPGKRRSRRKQHPYPSIWIKAVQSNQQPRIK